MKNTHGLIASLILASLTISHVGFADEIVVTESREAAATQSDDVNLDLLKETEAAVEKAIEAVLAETRLDLDIRLIGPTSVKIAGDR